MTVCIAIRGLSDSIAQDLSLGPIERIITIHDRMLSYGDDAVDNALMKRFAIHPRWRVMFAGNDIGPVTPLARTVERHLAEKEGHLEEVTDAFRNAYHEHSHLLAVDLILGKYGHTVGSWRRKGLNEFGAEEFARINTLIEQVEIDVQFLVCGFSPDGRARMSTVQQEWIRGRRRVSVEHNDVAGFSLIGIGTAAALSSLLRKELTLLELPALMYRACEAKMLAERVPGVGKGTVLSVLECKPPYNIVGERYLNPDWDALRAIWQNDAQRSIPDTALGMVRNAFNNSVEEPQLMAIPRNNK
jgi:hypothetical protein